MGIGKSRQQNRHMLKCTGCTTMFCTKTVTDYTELIHLEGLKMGCMYKNGLNKLAKWKRVI